MPFVARLFTWMLVAVVRLYQLVLSPFFPASCRYEPTCSQYAIDALRKYGPLAGLAKALRRIGRCHPYSSHTEFYDPA